MASYKETNVVGTKWTRCNSIHISNPLKVTPTITFFEEEVVDMGDTRFHRPSSMPIVDALNPSNEIALLDPSTGMDTGRKITEGFLYAAIFSKYIALAMERDRLNATVLNSSEILAQEVAYTASLSNPVEPVQDTPEPEQALPNDEHESIEEDPPVDNPAQ